MSEALAAAAGGGGTHSVRIDVPFSTSAALDFTVAERGQLTPQAPGDTRGGTSGGGGGGGDGWLSSEAAAALVVASVAAGSRAARAGVERGWAIVGAGGFPCSSSAELARRLAEHRGDTIVFRFAPPPASSVDDFEGGFGGGRGGGGGSDAVSREVALRLKIAGLAESIGARGNDGGMGGGGGVRGAGATGGVGGGIDRGGLTPAARGLLEETTHGYRNQVKNTRE